MRKSSTLVGVFAPCAETRGAAKAVAASAAPALSMVRRVNFPVIAFSLDDFLIVRQLSAPDRDGKGTRCGKSQRDGPAPTALLNGQTCAYVIAASVLSPPRVPARRLSRA